MSDVWEMFPEQLLLGEASQEDGQLWVNPETTETELQCAVSDVRLQDHIESQSAEPSDQAHRQEPVQGLQAHLSETKRSANPQQVAS